MKPHFYLVALEIVLASALAGCSSSGSGGIKAEPESKPKPPVDITLQKRINVTDRVSGEFLALGDAKKKITSTCLEKSIDSETLDTLLSKGVRVVTSSPWESPNSMNADDKDAAYLLKSSCYGTTYILEGPKSILSLL